jgi:DNA phosphorothioation-associated putative methyltransferase
VLVYLALRRFDGAFKMADLSPATQRDVRAHHRSLARATELADRLLFAVGSLDQVSIACRASSVGKLTPAALYVHVDALEHVPAVLKVYEGCARRIVGDVPGANILKLHRDAKKVSYLAYPGFDDDPHPPLHRSDVVDLVEQDLHTRRYPQERNVPILHRKEEFLHKGDPRWEGFRLVTEREVAAGLHADPSRIGYRHQWDELIRQSKAGGAPTSESG